MIRLLKKEEVNTLKATERRKEIDEGMKLAQKVDTLRETASKEEQNLAKFRDESMARLKTEIEEKSKESKRLDDEIASKRAERIKLEAPIDLTKEWKQLESDKKQVANERVELRDWETSLISRELVVSGLADREKEVIRKEQEAESYLEEARKSYSKTEDLRSDMERRKKESDADIQARYDTLIEKEQNIVSREFVINQAKEEIAKDKQEILEKGSELIARESKVEAETNALFERDEKLKEMEALTKRYNDEASKNYDNSENLRLEIEKIKREFEVEMENRLTTVADREKQVGYRERDIILQKEGIEDAQKLLDKEKLHIASQQETLRQAWVSLKKLQK